MIFISLTCQGLRVTPRMPCVTEVSRSVPVLSDKVSLCFFIITSSLSDVIILGISNAVGLAIAEAHMAAVFNKPDLKIVDNYTYVFCGDGCLQEGVSNEASSIAGHLGLGKLIVLYDDNKITIDGETELSFTEDVLGRYAALGWDVSTVKDGDHNLEEIAAAIEKAKSVTDKPSIIKVR